MVNFTIVAAVIIGVFIIASIIIITLWRRGVFMGKDTELSIGMDCDPEDDMCSDGYYCNPSDMTCSVMEPEPELELDMPVEADEPSEEPVGAPVDKAPLEPEPVPTPAAPTPEPKDAPVKTEAAPAKVPSQGFYVDNTWRWEPRVIPMNHKLIGRSVKNSTIFAMRKNCVRDNNCKGVFGYYYRDAADNNKFKSQFRLMSNVGQRNNDRAIPDIIYTKHGLTHAGRWTYLPRVWRYNKNVIPKNQRYLGNWIHSFNLIKGQQNCEKSALCKGIYNQVYKTDDGRYKTRFRLMRNVGVQSGQRAIKALKNNGLWTYLPRK